MNEIRRKRKRKKKSRKALWITLSVIVILVGSGYGGYYYMSHRDVQAEDIGVSKDFFDFSEFDDIGSIAGGDLQEPASGKETDTGTTKPSVNDSSEQGTDSQTPGEGKKTGKPASSEGKLQDIEAKYTKGFKRLESTALAKLDTLAENALHDYRTGRSLADLSSTYMSAANKLQDKVDGAFYNVLGEMKAELKAAGYNNDLADKAESEYKQAIADKKSEMLSKVTKTTSK